MRYVDRKGITSPVATELTRGDLPNARTHIKTNANASASDDVNVVADIVETMDDPPSGNFSPTVCLRAGEGS